MTNLSDLAGSQNPAVRASASRLLAKAAKQKGLTLEDLKLAGRVREMAASGDPTLAGTAMSWLSSRGLSISAPAPDPRVQKTADQVVAVAVKARREGWSVARRAAEIDKVLGVAFPKTRRLSLSVGSDAIVHKVAVSDRQKLATTDTTRRA